MKEDLVAKKEAANISLSQATKKGKKKRPVEGSVKKIYFLIIPLHGKFMFAEYTMALTTKVLDRIQRSTWPDMIFGRA